MYICMYVCTPGTNQIRQIFSTHIEQGLNFFITVDDLGFLCIHFFLIFIAKGGRCLRCVLCPDCRRWQKLPLSAQNVHAACLSLMRHHQHHYNFVGVVFSFVFCVFVYAPVLFAVLATLLFNTLHVVFTWRR